MSTTQYLSPTARKLLDEFDTSAQAVAFAGAKDNPDEIRKAYAHDKAELEGYVLKLERTRRRLKDELKGSGPTEAMKALLTNEWIECEDSDGNKLTIKNPFYNPKRERADPA